jgi:hypothetical protein
MKELVKNPAGFDLMAYINSELAKTVVDDSYCPNGRVQGGEDVFGVLDEDLQRLFCLRHNMTFDVNQQHEDMHPLHHSHDDAFMKAYRLAEFVDKYFWMQVRARFNIWGENEEPELREGWQVVSVEKPYEPESGFPFGLGVVMMRVG